MVRTCSKRNSIVPWSPWVEGEVVQMNRHSERFNIVWYVCSEYERADEPDRQLLEDMGFKWPTAGLLQTAIWEDMMEHGVDQNTISYNSLLSRSKEPRRNGGTRMDSETAAVRLRPGHQGRQSFSACSPPRRRHAQCSSCLQSCKAHGWATQIKGLATAPSTSLVAQNR